MRTCSIKPIVIGRSRFPYLLAAVGLVATSLLCADAWPATFRWKEPITGSWTVGANWCCEVTPPPDSQPLAPAALDDARINNGGTAQVTLESVTVTSVYLGQFPGNSGTVEVSFPLAQVTSGSVYLSDFDSDPSTGGSGTIRLLDGGAWVNRSSMYVGFGGTGNIEILGGNLSTPATGFFSFDHAYVVGEMLGSSGTVLVKDNGSNQGAWSTNFGILVGDAGVGTVEIKAGGTVHAHYVDVGEEFESVGNKIVVQGLNSKLQVVDLLHLGVAGQGILEIKEDASVSTGFAFVNPGSTATVDHASWENTNSLTLFGPLTVSNGGVVRSKDISILNGQTSVYAFLTATNKLSVSGNGDLTQVGTIIVSDYNSSIPENIGLAVGNLAGRGVFEVHSGGKYQSNGLSEINGLEGTRAIVRTNGRWQGNGQSSIMVGNDAFGELLIQTGGSVDLTHELIRQDIVAIGNAEGSNGKVVVSGGVLKSDELSVGGAGVGRLTIDGGGSVFSRSASIGNFPSETGFAEVAVTGANSKWEIEDALVVGSGNNASLTITNGAKVIANGNEESEEFRADVILADTLGNELISASVRVEGLGSELYVEDELIVGQKGFATLYIKDQASVANVHGWIGFDLGSNGTVVVDNANWASSQSIVVGFLGEATLDIRNDAVVTAQGEMLVGPKGTLQGTGTVMTRFLSEGTTAPGTPSEASGPGAGGDSHGSGGDSPGMLTIDGNFTQQSTGKLQIDLASPTSYDVLNVTGTATLGGTLEILLDDGFTPAPTDTFNFLTAGSQTGAFSNVIVNSASGSGGSFSLATTPTGLALSNYQPPPPILLTVSSEGGRFGTLDARTGLFTQTGSTSPHIIECLTRVGEGPLLGTDINASLRSVNPEDGSSTLLGNSGAALYGIAQRADGQLFGVSYNLGAASLYTIDPANGSATLVGALGVGTPYYNTTFDDTGTLFLASAPGRGSNSNLYRVDTTTGAATLIGPIGTGGDTMNVNSLVFVDGTLYGFTDGANATASLARHLIAIDRTTGAGTDLLSFATNGLDNVFGAVPFVSAAVLSGDYNDDGVVNAADYVMWRDHLGAASSLPNDATAGVALGDYAVWKENFGEPEGSGSAMNSQVPEPATVSLLMLGAIIWCFRRHRAV